MTTVTFWKVTKIAGLSVGCYVCGIPHRALGIARIRDSRSTLDVPICEPCFGADPDGVLRKYWNAPGLKITEGGEATTEQVEALADKQDETEH